MIHSIVVEGADAHPDHPAVITEQTTLTYGQLAAGAAALTARLEAAGTTRAALRLADPIELVTFLVAAAAAGVEPCIYPPGVEVGPLATRLGHRMVVESLDDDFVPDDARTDHRARSDGPLLVLTTGTTGEPRAIRHSWSRLAARSPVRPSSPERWLVAYGLHQFAGLQVVLHALQTGSTLLVPAATSPTEVAVALRDLHATHASGTPTMWRLVMAMLGDDAADLPLRHLTMGGEAVPDSLLDQLRAVWPHMTISQVYASTEIGSVVSVRDRKAGLPIAVLDRDESAPVQLRIQDGELWARSKVGMLGYLDEAESIDADGWSTWRSTGDRVEVVGERIVFLGRSSDIINVGGTKVHPLPVEETIRGIEGVVDVRVYGRPNAITGQVVAADVVAADAVDDRALVARVRAACAALPRAAQPRAVTIVEQLDTIGSKIVRRATS